MKAICLFLCVVLLGVGGKAGAQSETERLPNLTVTLGESSEKRDAAIALVDDVLAEYPGTAGRAPEFVATKTGQGILWGDLFKTGDCFALAELTAQTDQEWDAQGVAVAEWVNGRWTLRQVWDIPVVWRSKGWEANDKDYLPATPATQPFFLEDFSGDGVPEVVVAGAVHKYFQENFLLRFEPTTRTLNLVATAMDKPTKVEEYVRLYSDSGRRSIWSEWEFCRWRGNMLVPVAAWHSEVGYGENDPTYFEGRRFAHDGKETTIRVLYGQGQEIADNDYRLFRNGQPFGTMRITHKNPQPSPSTAPAAQEAWLFEKITGLPRRLYPDSAGTGANSEFEDTATVTVDGNEEAARLFARERESVSEGVANDPREK